MTTTELESRVLAMEAEIAELKERMERTEIDAAVKRGEERIARGETIPLRQAMESLRQKHNIPAK